ncbi:bifunctional UDP-sugar hydrolase/5'-nucleotidase [Exiguobacterium sp. MH3]|uniref:bifunctional metallophosphatase/5'-nucleotidase n=1 Tax=Exiguobacterium sp. MH3 TaxID=1399115 RepID=UPI0003C3B706|nr:bifunctional UDP-sugar hydrolase/5'-nucleotidase [Exiguobacterium sp. MH3]AHA30535.1 metallophosphoesterase [Exiguobacterium sp. MH3]
MKLHIIHYNDLHSHFDMWPRYMSFVKEHRTYDSLVFDLGDHADRVDPATEATKGKINTHLLNALMPTAVTIGNNEGITFPHDWLANLYTEADFPVLVSNLEAPFAKQGVIHELPTGKVGVFGLTAPYIELYGLLGWTIEEPFDVAAREIEHLRQEVDVLICLSHLGFYQDEELAMRFPELDLIIGAHTHHVLDDGVVKNGVLITQAGKHGQYAGEIYMNTDTGEKEAVLHSLHDYVEDEATAKLLDREQYLAEQQMKEPIGETSGLANDWFSESPFSQLLVETMRDWCDADIACVPAGILLGSLPPGPVSAFDLHRLCPHPINPCKVTMTGVELQTFLDEVKTDQFEQLKVRGLGFRGKLMGRMHYAGLAAHQPLEPTQNYTVVLPDMFTFGPLFPAIKEMPKEYFMPELLRDLLFERLSEKSEYNELHVRKP